MGFKKLQNSWVAITLFMSSCVLCKILSFLTRVAPKVDNTSGLRQLK